DRGRTRRRDRRRPGHPPLRGRDRVRFGEIRSSGLTEERGCAEASTLSLRSTVRRAAPPASEADLEDSVRHDETIAGTEGAGEYTLETARDAGLGHRFDGDRSARSFADVPEPAPFDEPDLNRDRR